MKQSDYMYK